MLSTTNFVQRSGNTFSTNPPIIVFGYFKVLPHVLLYTQEQTIELNDRKKLIRINSTKQKKIKMQKIKVVFRQKETCTSKIYMQNKDTFGCNFSIVGQGSFTVRFNANTGPVSISL